MGVGFELKRVGRFLGKILWTIKVRGWMLVILAIVLVFAIIQMAQTFS